MDMWLARAWIEMTGGIYAFYLGFIYMHSYDFMNFLGDASPPSMSDFSHGLVKETIFYCLCTTKTPIIQSQSCNASRVSYHLPSIALPIHFTQSQFNLITTFSISFSSAPFHLDRIPASPLQAHRPHSSVLSGASPVWSYKLLVFWISRFETYLMSHNPSWQY